MRPTGNCSPALDDRETALVPFGLPRPPPELIFQKGLVARSPDRVAGGRGVAE
jgi:hypothetical protein